MRTVRIDSIYDPMYIRRFLQRELSERTRRFFDGLMNRQVAVADTLTIVAVGETSEKYRIPMTPIIVPESTARRLSSAGIRLDDPSSILAALQSGDLFRANPAHDGEYSRVTLDLHPQASVGAVADSARALGFRVHTGAEVLRLLLRGHGLHRSRCASYCVARHRKHDLYVSRFSAPV